MTNTIENEGTYFKEVIERTRGVVLPSYRDMAFKWLDMSREERIACQLPTTQKDFAKSIGIGTTKMRLFKREFFSLNMKGKIDRKEVQPKDYDSLSYLKSRTREVDEGIIKSAKSGNAQAQRLIKQLTGELVEKSEVTIGLTADERARRELEAERQLREWRGGAGHRVEEVQKEPPLLSK